MTVEIIQTLSLIAFIASGVFFLVAVALFFLLDVPKLVGELSGRTARKAIEAINQHNNESSGLSSSKLGSASATGSKLTDKITKSGRIEKHTSDLSLTGTTEKFSTATLNQNSNKTTVLNAPAGETTVLNNISSSNQGETTVLNNTSCNQQAETTVLNNSSADNAYGVSFAAQNLEFRLDVEMSFLGSSEIIE